MLLGDVNLAHGLDGHGPPPWPEVAASCHVVETGMKRIEGKKQDEDGRVKA
jgi:hypothetical protein